MFLYGGLAILGICGLGCYKYQDLIKDALNLFLYKDSLQSGENYYDVPYYSGVTKYTARFPKVRGPCMVLGITAEGEDVTDRVVEFMGVTNNFHSIPTTPKLLGYTSLNFSFINGSESVFSEDTFIDLDLGRCGSILMSEVPESAFVSSSV